MADIELMTTRHSNDIITRLDKLEEQIVRKGVPKGAQIERINNKGDLIIEGPIRILYLWANFNSNDIRNPKLIIDDHDFDVGNGNEITIYNDIYHTNKFYIDGTTYKYNYYDNLPKFVQHFKASKIDLHRAIIGENMDVNYLEVRGRGYISATANIIYIKL